MNFSSQGIEDALGRFYRGPGAKYGQAAADFFKQCPNQTPKVYAAIVAARRASLAVRFAQAALATRNAALAADAADIALDIDGLLVAVGGCRRNELHPRLLVRCK